MEKTAFLGRIGGLHRKNLEPYTKHELVLTRPLPAQIHSIGLQLTLKRRILRPWNGFVVRFPFPEFVQQVGCSKDIDGPLEVVDCHDQGKLTVYFFQSPEVCIIKSPLPFDDAEDVLADRLPSFVQFFVLLEVFQVCFTCIRIIASLYLPTSVFSSCAEVFERTCFTIWGSVLLEQVAVPLPGLLLPGPHLQSESR